MPNKQYDLEDRTLKFAKDCIDLCKLLIRDTINIGLVSQLIRASSSVGANYREANDSTTKKDFYYRIGICRRESGKIEPLIDEALQLARIFASIAKDSL